MDCHLEEDVVIIDLVDVRGVVGPVDVRVVLAEM